MASQADISNRFDYHPPPSDHVRALHEATRDMCRQTADTLTLLVPEGRELSVVLTKIEEAMFWANAGIARYDWADDPRHLASIIPSVHD